MMNCNCGEKQYLDYDENNRLHCLMCGAEDTGDYNQEETK